ncbi:nucleoside hydrolase [Microbacterium halophytorum]|uniref:nucleoside hydrolase n=1 Tax=Microbacterium halophytorum TaxID=2067568 RepID=UPI000CFB2497|nr:nucleoside hydrolase [Microbacterium halophytorum]
MTWTLKPRAAVVVDNDWAGDPDGLVALAHHALSPADDVVLVTGSFTSPSFGDPTGSAAQGAGHARELLDLIGGHDGVPTVGGADAAFDPAGRETAAARAIVEAVRAHSEVVVVCGGPLTNIADALAADPSIAPRVRLAWVGGSIADEFEYNRDTDPAAAEFVFAHDGLRIDRFPLETYRLMAVSVAELEDDLTSSGAVGRWLWQKYLDLPLPPQVDVDPVWPLGDSAPLAVTALPHAAARFAQDGAARRTCTALDARLIIGDFFARLRLHARIGEFECINTADSADTQIHLP